MERARFWIVGLLSLTVIALEVLWTRIFSAEYFYTFAFLILSFAILGLGLGALVVRLLPRLGDAKSPSLALVLVTISGLAGPAIVLRLGLDFSLLYKSPAMIALFALALLVLAAPFFFAGVALAWIFRTYHSDMPRLYMADLIGAGLGVGLAVVAMNMVEVPLTAVLACVPVAVSAVLASGRFRLVSSGLAVMIVLAGIFSRPMLTVARKELGPVIVQHWDAMAKVKINDMDKDYRNINIDNAANSPVLKFDGNLGGEKAKEIEGEFLFHFRPLLGGKNGYTVASLGAGGGSEVLQGLIEGAGEIHAIEVNGAINRMMTTGELAEFSGRIYSNPKVKVISEDGRAYLRRFFGKFDLIVSSSANSFAALASGAFALSENYLFTTEAFRDYLRALKPGGYLLMEHQFYIPRAVSEVRDALRGLGIVEGDACFAVYELPKRRRMVLLLSNRPLSKEAIDVALGPLSVDKEAQVRLIYPTPGRDGLVSRIVANGWEREAASAPTDISPCTDDRPFVAQLGLWRNVTKSKFEKITPYEFSGFPISKLIILTILAVVVVLVIPLLFLPRFFGKTRLGAAPWLYFFAIGVGFMIIEVVLIQQFSLLIGASSTSLVAVLLTLLIASGVGSRFALKVSDAVPFVGILVWLGLDILFFSTMVKTLGALPTTMRTIFAMALIIPLGVFMGMPFPKAALRVGDRIDWGFAVNGVASVIGSTAIILIAVAAGFRISLAVGAAFYSLALVLLTLCRAGWMEKAPIAVEPDGSGLDSALIAAE